MIGGASDDIILECVDVGCANTGFMYLNLRKLGGFSPSSSGGPELHLNGICNAPVLHLHSKYCTTHGFSASTFLLIIKNLQLPNPNETWSK